MELYYNPEQMPEAEIKQTFVGRQPLLDELLALIKRQPNGAGVQHVLLIGARGMGKTTMLLMLRFAVLAGALRKKWQPVRFPEESYAVTDLADFWLAAIGHLSYETGDKDLAARGDALRNEFKTSADLAGAALATLRDWSRKHGRRLLLLVDNLDMLMNQIGDTTENARLRDALMNDGTLMLVGGATSFFHEARSYDQPLHNFFKMWNLDALEGGQINQLLLKRAEADGRTDFEQQLKQNEARINVLHYFTGGNPRLVLMLYRIVASSELIDVQRGLEKLLDEVTPYYKAKIESLPPQQRKILDHIAQVSARTRSGLTPTEIAAGTRLPVNQVTSQLKRLSGLGYVRAANVRARSSWYSLAEPLYAIWHQMRFGRESRERMAWLVEFLKGWYSSEEVFDETEKLAARFKELMSIGDKARAAETFNYRQVLAGASDERLKGGVTDRLIDDCLDAGATDRVRSIVRSDGLMQRGSSTIQRLADGGILSASQLKAEDDRRSSLLSRLAFNCGPRAFVEAFDPRSLPLHEMPYLWFVRAVAMHALGREDEAFEDLDTCSRLSPGRPGTPALSDEVPHGARKFSEMIGIFVRHIDEFAPGVGAQLCTAMAIAMLGDMDTLNAVNRTVLARHQDKVLQQMFRRLPAMRQYYREPLNRFAVQVATGAFADARESWNEKVLRIVPTTEIVAKLRTVIDDKSFRFVRELIRESNLDNELLPLAVAMDYLETGDRSPLERLSAEVRPVAEKIVAGFRRKLSGSYASKESTSYVHEMHTPAQLTAHIFS